jgi:hypothetical protein
VKGKEVGMVSMDISFKEFNWIGQRIIIIIGNIIEYLQIANKYE